MVDQIPEDQTIRQAADADYRYIGIDTTALDVAMLARNEATALAVQALTVGGGVFPPLFAASPARAFAARQQS